MIQYLKKGDGTKHVTLSQPMLWLCFPLMKKGWEEDSVAHEIAHYILGHHHRDIDVTNERETDDLIEKWGFRRCYKEEEYPGLSS